MVEQVFLDLQKGDNVRANLIFLKENIEDYRQKILQWEENVSALQSFLRHEDAKTRKNAALLLGKLGIQEAAAQLWQAYQAEDKLFVKSAYLGAMEQLEIKEWQSQIRERYDILCALDVKDDEKKHINEEKKALELLIYKLEGNSKHKFTGYDQENTVLLTTNPKYRQVCADQIKHGQSELLALGVKVTTHHLREICNIRSYREMLFFLPGAKGMDANPEAIAKGLVNCQLSTWLERLHEGTAPFYFRIEYRGAEPEDRGDFLRKIGVAIEEESNRSLLNSTDKYEVEIRLLQNKSGKLIPFIKLHTIPMRRFAYRKNVIAYSIQPSSAALLMKLAEPYLQEEAEVLDPFCGVGTMLIERDMLVPAGDMYGTDIFGEAIVKARENTSVVGRTINYINRNFFDFTHRHLFDEIVTNMPERGRKTKEEQDRFYAEFFEQASTLLGKNGVIIMYSNENGFVKKQLRLREDFCLRNEFCIREKEGYFLFIIGVKR